MANKEAVMNNIGDKVIISMGGLTVCADVIGIKPLTVRVGKSSRIVVGASERIQIINVNTGRSYGNLSEPKSRGLSKHTSTRTASNKSTSSKRNFYRVDP